LKNKNVKQVFKTKYTNFEQLESVIRTLNTTKEQGDAMEQFASFYFNYFNLLYDVENVYMGNEIPKGIRERIKLELTDYGVDGVIEKKNGNIVAYQVKFRSSRDGITATELSTFWAESEYADERLIISNCRTLPKVTNKKKNQSTVMLSDLLDLDTDFFEALFNYFNTNDKQIIRKKFSPREYQQNIIENIKKGFSLNDRGKLIAACGVGKTLMALWLQEQMGVKSVLYIVPSLALIKQTLESWTKNSNDTFSYLCVCSDSSVADFEDEIVANSTEVSFPVTTNADDIVEFLKLDDEKKIIFSTYNSLDVIVSALMQYPNYIFDLGIFDESHRTAGTKQSKMFVYGLDDNYINIDKRLFMTATERLVTPRVRKQAEEVGDVIFSMDDEEKYGPVFDSLNFGEAIEKEIISDYKIILVTMDEDSLKKYEEFKIMNNTQLGEANKIIDKEVLMKQLILNKVIKEIGIRKVITYHSYVKNARIFIQGDNTSYSFEQILDGVNSISGDAYIGHVNGEMSAGSRKEILKKFEQSELGIVSNARCLTEGVDVPVIDAVYFADPKNSLVDIVQAVGRSLRKSKDKKLDYSYIIIPVLISNSVNSFEQLNESDFSTLYNVIQAMRLQDKNLADEIDNLNMDIARGNYKKGSGNGASKLSIVPYDNLSIDDFSDSLNIKIATYNKDVGKDKLPTEFWQEKNARKSQMKRVFVSIGDYTLDKYKESLIEPTLSKFIELNKLGDSLTGKDLKVNNNNVSHSRRFGVIEQVDNGYIVTDIGKSLIESNYQNYKELSKRQLIYYYSVNSENNSIIFPYRAILKVLLKTNYLTRLEFLYCIYSLRSTSSEDIADAINNVFHIRETFPNIESLNTTNKEKALDILNTKLNLEFSYKDIWTSRTTTYNQFNYFKRHLSYFDDFYVEGDKNKIEINIDRKDKLEELLNSTSDIEEFNEVDENLLREKYISI
jgi:hypothetical protein